MNENQVQVNRRVCRSASFGPFELCLETGILKKHGVRVRLQGKPFQILSALLEDPGAVITREELRARLWSDDTYVDFESGLNTAANRLRAALNDSAEHPLYVETLNRIGYRFIAPVQFAETPPVESRGALPASTEILDQPPSSADVLNEIIPRANRKWPTSLAVVAGLVLVAAVWAGWAVRWGGAASGSDMQFRRLTFQSGSISGARFSRDGKQIFFGAEWNGAPSHLFVLNTATGNTEDTGLASMYISGVSPRGFVASYLGEGQSRRMSLIEASRRVEQNLPEAVMSVDWSADGREWQVVRRGSGVAIESPPGHILLQSSTWLDPGALGDAFDCAALHLRVSPDSSMAAFIRRPVPWDDAGDIVLIRPGSEPRTLSSGWASVNGLAWSRSGREVWFTAAAKGASRQLMAVDLKGRVRQVAAMPGGLTLHDIAANGEVLITRDATQVSMFLGNIEDGVSRDVSWLDWPAARTLTPDGKLLLFDESADSGGGQYSSYLYDAQSGAHRRIGDGRALDLSADGRWALTQAPRDLTDVRLLETGTGAVTRLAARNFLYRWIRFTGTQPLRAIAGGSPTAGEDGVFTIALPSGSPSRVSAEMVDEAVLDGSGRLMAGIRTDGSISVVDLQHGSSRILPNPNRAKPLRFLNAETILTSRMAGRSIIVESLNVDDGTWRPYRQIHRELAVIPKIMDLRLAGDLKTYAISGEKSMSTLFAVTGWR